MRRPWTTWLARCLWCATAALFAVGATIQQVAGDQALQTSSLATKLGLLVAFFGFATVGAAVAARQPRNAVGWIFLAVGFLVSVSLSSGEFANYSFSVRAEPLPAASLAAWLYMWAWFPAIGLIAFLPLLFPDGRVPGRRWRPVQWALVVVLVEMTVTAWFLPGSMNEEAKPPWPDNPLGVGALKPAYDVGGKIAGISFVLLLLASMASTIVRFRRSRGDERQQLKWMLFAVAVLVLGVVIQGIVGIGVGDLGFAAGVALLPAAAAVAMLRYRLYDVDRVISKTLVYGALTVVLGAAYVGLVLAGQALFSSFAGGSNLAIAVSTLVVAALFLPVRSRVQAFVDRRFYRRRYDAQRTLEAFGARLREQVDLEGLCADLERVVIQTMQPARVSTWLRSDR